MRIESVAAQPDRAGRYLIKLDDGCVLRLYRQTVEDFCIYAGKELSPEDFQKLTEAAGMMSAKMRAVRIVSATSVSRRDLEQRLLNKGENPEQARAAVEWMTELKLVDDAAMAEQVVRRCAEKGYGVARARQMLYEKRIPRQYWHSALEDYPDQQAHIQEYLHGHLRKDSDAREIKKVVDALLRRGHSYPEIRKGLDRLSLGFDDFREE